jgi:hypothetical protein
MGIEFANDMALYVDGDVNSLIDSATCLGKTFFSGQSII